MRRKGRNPCGNLSCFSRGHSRKRGAITMPYLIGFILAVVLIVLISYGITNKGFGPLMENIGGRFDEVLILLHIRDDPADVSCGDAFPQEIDGVGDGMFYPCEDSCAFVLGEGDELLGFDNFATDKNGFVASNDGKIPDDDKAYVFDSVEAERHRDAYVLLKKAVDVYLVSPEADGMSEEEFVERMSFNSGRTLYWEFDCLRTRDNCAYAYGGDGSKDWKKGQIEDEKFVKEGKEDFNGLTVSNALRKSYANNKEVSWWYIYDKEKHVILPTSVGNERYHMNEEQFGILFNTVRFDWIARRDAQDELEVNLETFIKDGSAGDIVLGEVVVDGYAFPMLTLVADSEKFGLYYVEEGDVLFYMGGKSVVSDFVGLSDPDWVEFVKINKIYEHFKLRRCKA